jgi:hypothetical protein
VHRMFHTTESEVLLWNISLIKSKYGANW